MSDSIRHLSDSEFNGAINAAEQPVLVDFWADWCGPCQAIAPALDELAQNFAGKLTVAKLNVDQNPNTARQFGIRSIPTLYLFRNGEVVAKHTGAASYGLLKAFVNQAV